MFFFSFYLFLYVFVTTRPGQDNSYLDNNRGSLVIGTHFFSFCFFITNNYIYKYNSDTARLTVDLRHHLLFTSSLSDTDIDSAYVSATSHCKCW